MNSQIKEFVEHQSCGSISVMDERLRPYSFTVFYAFNVYENLLYFKSDENTKHASLLRLNPFISGTILPDKFNHLHIRGVQFEGLVLDESDPHTKNAAANYYHKHPFASAMPGEIWTMRINHIKYTDNWLEFGKHFTWVRQEEVAI